MLRLGELFSSWVGVVPLGGGTVGSSVILFFILLDGFWFGSRRRWKSYTHMCFSILKCFEPFVQQALQKVMVHVLGDMVFYRRSL